MTARRSCRAVLDIGKTNARLCAADDDGRVLESLRRTSDSGTTPPYRHLDVEPLFEWILSGLNDLTARYDVRSIVPVTHGATAALLAGDELALPVLDYEQEIPSEIGAEYDSLARDFAHTGSPALPLGLNLGRQLFWQEAAFPGHFTNVTDVLLYPQYWAYRLSSSKVSEVTSLGCHTDLWEPGASQFSTFAQSRAWPKLFPPMVPAWETVGGPTPEVRARTGLASDCRILAGIHDSNASFLAHRAPRNDDFCVVSTGTWIICMAHGAEGECLREDLDMLANVDAFGDPVPSARFMGGREYAAIAGPDVDAKPTADDVRAVVQSGAMALPSFSAEGGPFPSQSGRTLGAERLTAAGRAALAAIYCALVTDSCLDLLGVRSDIVIEGRFAANEAYAATLAALRPSQHVSVSTDETGSVAGAALLLDLGEGTSVSMPTPRPVVPCEPALLDPYRSAWRTKAGVSVRD